MSLQSENTIHTNEINNINIQKYYSYICFNCNQAFYGKNKIKHEYKFCNKDCRSSWIIKKYNNNICYIDILSKEFENEYYL